VPSLQCRHHDWFSLFLKPENATDVVVLIPENVTVSMLVQGESERDDINDPGQPSSLETQEDNWTRERFAWVMLLPRRLNTLDPESDVGISRSVRVSPPWSCFQCNGRGRPQILSGWVRPRFRHLRQIVLRERSEVQ
jgi:hypothetical protein